MRTVGEWSKLLGEGVQTLVCSTVRIVGVWSKLLGGGGTDISVWHSEDCGGVVQAIGVRGYRH